MKKLIFVLSCLTVILSSCSTTAKVITTSTSKKAMPKMLVSPVRADLKVSSEKIVYTMVVNETVAAGGYDNIVETAVNNALERSSHADVLLALQTQTKYDANGRVESITVSGYPASYVNFRTCPEDTPAEESAASSQGYPLFKFGK